jgi:hypothetical protein
MASDQPGPRTEPVRVKEFLEQNADEELTAPQVAQALGISTASAAISLGYLAAYRGECRVVRQGVYVWTPFDDAFDRRLEARDLAERIVALLS